MAVRLLALLLAGLTGMFAAETVAQSRVPEPVRQGFRVCNQTSNEIEVAKALNTGATDGKNRLIVSEGWYKLAGGACLFLWPGKLEYQYYLIYAQNKAANREWAGKVPLCVSREAFTIRSDTCGEQSYRRMFIDVDTGDERNLFTYNFRPGS